MMFSVILPTYNRRASLLECLDRLSHQTFAVSEFEVIVVVDGSTDGTRDALLSQHYPFHIEVIEKENGGPSSARNSGASHARSDYLAFTEDDIIPDADWLDRAAAVLRNNPAIDLLEGRTVSASDRKNIRQFDIPGKSSFIPCNLFIRRELFLGLSGYDPAFYDPVTHLYFREDADLGFRAMDAGARIMIAPDVVVSHPFQFPRVKEALRHASRYVFDPLLYRKHPMRYRSMIEQKEIFGFKLRRLHHVVTLVYLADLACLAFSIFRLGGGEIVIESLVALLCVLFFKFKYQGRAGFQRQRLVDLPAFAVVPLVYLRALVLGSFRYRSFGTLIP